MALTDHGTLANAISFSVECENRGIKPIIGVEGYVEVDGDIGHLTVLADGNQGFDNLVKLNNIGHASSHRQPAFSIDDLINHAEGLILLSGCVSSPLNRMPFAEAMRLGSRLKSAFGSRMFGEIMFIADVDTWTRPIELAEKLNLRLVVTNDVHFPSNDDAEIHPILTQMKAGFDYNSKELWLKSPSEIWLRAQDTGLGYEAFKEATHRSARIAEKIKPIIFKHEPTLPYVKDAEKKLRSMVMGIVESYSDEYRKQAEYELSIITSMGYATYFLVLYDLIQFANKNDVRVGPGRGSGAGSLVLFLLGITKIDPLKYGLSFERFLNPERKGMPDVDTDFDSEGRQRVIDYASRKWGATQIATYSRYSHKVLVHDLAKTLKLDHDLELKAADGGIDSDEFKKLNEESPLFGKAYETISGQIRHRGKHAGGVIITSLSVPIERTAEGTMVAAWVEGEHNELSYAGVVKFDLLGLSALSALHRLEKKYGYEADRPVDHHPAFKIFRDGDLGGIFQFSGSDGIRNLTLRLAPEKFDDLVAINALYRPGTLDVGVTDLYPDWKKTPRVVNPIIADILEPTYGAIVYQEQVMAIYARITKGSFGQADLARRVIVKSKVDDPKWVAEFEALQTKFIEAAKERGLSDDDAEELWKELAAHSRYSFNRAHAVAYAYVAWETAWWKWKHPAAFYSEMMNVDPTEQQTYLIGAVQSGIEVVPPHINESGFEYTTSSDEQKIYMPLTSVKFLSMTAANAIIQARDSYGKFESYETLMSLVPKKLFRGNARGGMFHLGAFSGLSGDIRTLAIKDDIETIKGNKFEIQQQFLGLIIPTKKLMENIANEAKKGNTAGVVSEIKQKESRYGPYTVYHLSPSGVFWSREEDKFKVGDIVVATISGKTGKATKVRRVS